MPLSARSKRWFRIAGHEQVVLTLLAVLVGIVVAYAAIAFRLGIAGAQWLGYGFGEEAMHDRVAQLPWWQVLLVPTFGGLAVGLFLRFLTPGGRAQNVSHVIEANALSGGRLSLKQGLASAIASATSLGIGASAGREGPMVHFGATLASAIAQALKLNPALARTILGCGVAAAVAASFNAPIAGVFFALEVVLGHYALSAFAPIVIASVASTVIARIHLGAEPAFNLPASQITSLLEFPAFLILGIVAAAVAMIFMSSIIFADRVVGRIAVPEWLKPAAGGLAVGVIAIWFPHILGVGYGATDDALRAQFSLGLLLALLVLKTATTAVSLGCRFGGGVFSPSLYIGAMTGGAFGLIAAQLFPALASSPGVYALVGMSAVAAAVLGAPISTILIVFEMTADYKVTIAVMVATAAASVIVQQVLGKSFFHWQLETRGLDLRGGRARHLLRSLNVRQVLSADYQQVAAEASVGDIKRLLGSLSVGDFVVTDADGRLIGTFAFSDLRDVIFQPELDSLVNARDLVDARAPVVTPGAELERVLKLMDLERVDRIAVVEDLDTRRVIGLVHRKDVLLAFNQALLEAQAEEHDERR
jgi:chloride channel protein, CIC family